MKQPEAFKGYQQTKRPNVINLEQGKIPPQAIDLEEVVLGAMMIDKKGVDEVIDILSIESFYKEKKFSYVMMGLKTSWKFFNHYILRLGILDGKKGFTICYLNSLGVLERYRELKRLEQKNELAYYLVMP